LYSIDILNDGAAQDAAEGRPDERAEVPPEQVHGDPELVASADADEDVDDAGECRGGGAQEDPVTEGLLLDLKISRKQRMDVALTVAKAERALRLAKAAQKKFRDTSNEVDTIENLDQAGRLFLAAGKPLRAAEAYVKCAEATRGETSAVFFAKAAEAREVISPLDACDDYERAAELCCEAADWDLAAYWSFRIAELADDLDLSKADRAHRYRATADLTENPNLRTYCLSKAADLEATDSRYDSAAKLFQDLALDATESNLTRLNATRHFFRAVLCHLADEAFDVAKGKLAIFVDYDISFRASPERRFLIDALDCLVVLDDPTTEGLVVNDDEDDDSSREDDDDDESQNDDDDSQNDGHRRRHRPDDKDAALQERQVPDLDRFVDRAYDLASVRDLGALELTLLKRIHDIILARIAKHQRKLDRQRRRAEKLHQKERDERQRQLRIARDARPASGDGT